MAIVDESATPFRVILNAAFVLPAAMEISRAELTVRVMENESARLMNGTEYPSRGQLQVFYLTGDDGSSNASIIIVAIFALALQLFFKDRNARL